MTNWCRNWLGSICSGADVWRAKIKLTEIIDEGYKAFKVEGLPCWSYTSAGDHSWGSMPSSVFRNFTKSGCWHGICFHHSTAMTAMLQAKTKGGWTLVSGYQVRAMRISTKGHAYCELYIKGRGYYEWDVSMPSYIVYTPQPRSEAVDMCNMHHCSSNGGVGNMGFVAYNPTWAGFPREAPPTEPPPYEPPTKSHINCSTNPSNAHIWLKKR